MHPSILLASLALPLLISALSQSTTTVTLNKRFTLQNADGTIDLEAVRANIRNVERKMHQGFLAYEKNTGTAFPFVGRIQKSKRDSGDVPLTDYTNDLWYGNILVGSPGSQYIVDFDTGSSDLFLPGSNCGTTCEGHNIYNPNTSSTSSDLRQSFNLTYGEGSSVYGEQYTDTVSLAGYNAINQTLGVAQHYSSGFSTSRFPADGVLGMAFGFLSRYGANPVFQNLVAGGNVPEPIFAVKLASSGSELHIGGVNTDLYTGAFTYTPVSFPAYWQIRVDSLNVNNKQVNNKMPCIVDTGTTMIIANTSVVEQFYNALNGTSVGGGLYTLPCASMPNVSFTINGTIFDLSPDTFNFGTYNSSGEACVGAIAANDGIGELWVLGDAFLRNAYTVFDVGASRMGFARLA